MKLEQSFTVTAPIEQVWAALIDVERVAPCLPGAEITGQAPDGGYQGTFSVKLGPATAAYNGSLRMESLDEATHTATMTARGTDKRGQGGANASIVSTMHQEGDDTLVEVVTDFTITGRLARFGRGGMIEDISKRLMRDFAQCLQATLAAEPAPVAAAPVEAAEPQAPLADELAAAEPAEPIAEAPAPVEPIAAEPLQPAQAPWPPAAAEPAAPAAEEPAAPDAAPSAPLPGEEPMPETPPEGVEPSPAGGLPGEAEPVAAAEPAPAPPAEPAAPPPRTGSIPPPSAVPRPAAQPAKPVKGFSLLFSVLWERVKRFFGRLFRRKRDS
jgi:carbon monoxide dehydrogenase subunit G